MAEPARHRTIRLAKIKAILMPLGSLVIFISAAAATTTLGIKEFFARLISPMGFFCLCLFISIFFPAYMRIYYILLLENKGIFTTKERRTHQEAKQRWDRYLLRSTIAATFLLLVLGIWLRWH